jgi:hypothetical protein
MTSPVWNTSAGTLGIFPANSSVSVQLSASATLPATSVTYELLSGELPTGLSISITGLITGTTSDEQVQETIQFGVRATDNLAGFRDRTFSMTIGGTNVPQFVTPGGTLIAVYDSIWTALNIEFTNPISTNTVTFNVVEGTLPSGLEINNAGLIRGYAAAPTQETIYPATTTTASATSATNNSITCFSTMGFYAGRTVSFSLTAFGNIIENQVYYIKEVINSSTFTISTTQNGPEVTLATASGFMQVSLPQVSIGAPTIRTYTFNLRIDSPLGSDIETYSIIVINQNLPISAGGPGFAFRSPVLYNTRPPTYNIQNDEFYGYYVLPPASLYGEGGTYPLTTPAPIGQFTSDEFFAWKSIGYSYDNATLKYQYVGLPSGLSGDFDTGWITGTPSIPVNTITEYDFSVVVYNANNTAITTPEIKFSMIVANNIIGDITWLTPSDLGNIYNGTVSLKRVEATSDVSLEYTVVSGSLPPNLTLDANGDIIGIVAWQPTSALLSAGDQTIFTFTVQAYSPVHSIVTSEKIFTLTVIQEFDYPTDTLYIKAAPTLEDRRLITSLLTNETLIPTDMVFRPDDSNFGKAQNVTYVHAYGIKSSSVDEYIAAINKNHYWRYITLGSLQTAVAKDSNGNVLYEVVYSSVIDNLINPQGTSVQEDIVWPFRINLGLGPWYTSVTNIFTSYDLPAYFSSLTPGSTRLVYPNSLPNMRDRVRQELGPSIIEQGSSYYKLLPLWMTSQQASGSTLGYTPAWVICYTKPYIVVDGQSLTYAEFNALGLDSSQYQSYAEIIKNNIETLWKNSDGEVNKLNVINFQLDRFTVDKSSTYNYNNYLVPPAWISLPSGQPVPNPTDSEDFYVLYPRKTILPNTTQS